MDALFQLHLNVLMEPVHLLLLEKMVVHQLLNALTTNLIFVLMENVLEIFAIVEYNTRAQLKIQLDVQTYNVWISFLNVNKFYNAL